MAFRGYNSILTWDFQHLVYSCVSISSELFETPCFPCITGGSSNAGRSYRSFYIAQRVFYSSVHKNVLNRARSSHDFSNPNIALVTGISLAAPGIPNET
jgi:hypothetical protein